MPDVFINYRTGDGEKNAAVIDRELSRRFGEDRIFRASKSIKPGDRFAQELLANVRRSGVLLAVMGQGWSASRALYDEADWVRREILEALACGIPVIPVLDGRKAERLRAADLPVELALLAEVQSLRLDLQNALPDLERIGDAVADLVPALRDADRTVRRTPEPGSVTNTAETVNGTVTQARDVAVTGDLAGTVVKGSQAALHTGKGDIHHHDGPQFTGDGATYVAGTNRGGIRHQFGGSRRREDDAR
ncbi:toll/interleukin-1 receptor domain-containing protein [Kitasatospora mediocidica]|uniref:toll/interleukin-1 receptor domain-containing protein n=1 Tax=Kitasatospora mediocidica TaxID=58352 RepID=UPI00055E9D39|nr:toll/interleukin-1 receptor domain-containing protein [Kitasatospora mediocidica]